MEGQAKLDFLEWLEIQDLAPYVVMFDVIPEFVKHSYIIKWLDEINYIIEVQFERNTNQYFGYVLDLINGIKLNVSGNYHSRFEFNQSAIEKANEIYNANN